MTTETSTLTSSNLTSGDSACSVSFLSFVSDAKSKVEEESLGAVLRETTSDGAHKRNDYYWKNLIFPGIVMKSHGWYARHKIDEDTVREKDKLDVT